MNAMRCYKYNLLNVVVKSERGVLDSRRAFFLDTSREEITMSSSGEERDISR